MSKLFPYIAIATVGLGIYAFVNLTIDTNKIETLQQKTISTNETLIRFNGWKPSVAIGDLNNDGTNDIVIAYESYRVHQSWDAQVLINKGNNKFEPLEIKVSELERK